MKSFIITYEDGDSDIVKRKISININMFMDVSKF